MKILYYDPSSREETCANLMTKKLELFIETSYKIKKL